VSDPLQALIVEDSEDDALLILRELKRGGFEPLYSQVQTAEDMENALRKHLWDVVLSDHHLPRFSAPAALAILKRSTLDIPFIIVSGSIGEDAAVSILKAGAHDYVPKSSLARLVPAIRRELREAANRRSRAAAEEALRVSEERYALAVRGAHDGIWDWNLETDHVYFSPRWQSILGLGEGEVGDTLANWFARVHPEDLPRLKRDLEDHASARSQHLENEHRLAHRNGNWLWMLVRGLAVRSESGRPVRMAGSLTDITARKQLDRMKDELIATVSHELRTPLTSIYGSLRLVASGSVGEIPEKARTLIQVACKNSERLSRLISDILDVAKIESGKITIRLKSLDLSGLAEQVVRDTHAWARESNVQVVLGSTVPGARVLGDEDRLMQVMSNLLSNAVKFSPGGGTVTVSVRRSDGRLRVTVTDRGPGIPKEFHPRLFQRFSQADSSDARLKGGTGLGLSIAKAIVERHGGQIGFISEPGVETSFYFELKERQE
jgi:PAS domain S-box-containing protein